MFLSDASIRRPVAMGCLLIALAILGLNAARKIGLELMPRADMPYVTITTIYPGASPSEIESDIVERVIRCFQAGRRKMSPSFWEISWEN